LLTFADEHRNVPWGRDQLWQPIWNLWSIRLSGLPAAIVPVVLRKLFRRSAHDAQIRRAGGVPIGVPRDMATPCPFAGGITVRWVILVIAAGLIPGLCVLIVFGLAIVAALIPGLCVLIVFGLVTVAGGDLSRLIGRPCIYRRLGRGLPGCNIAE